MEAHERLNDALRELDGLRNEIDIRLHPEHASPAPLLAAGIEAACSSYRRHATWILHRAAAVCESPIEEMLLYALANCCSISIRLHDERAWELHPEGDWTIVQPQSVIGEYRVDFLHRFTGSEIWRDPIGCAREIIRGLSAAIHGPETEA